MTAIWRLLSIAYRKAKVRLQKEEERDRRTHFLKIQRGSKSQDTKENTVGDMSQREGHIRIWKASWRNTLTSWKEQKGSC